MSLPHDDLHIEDIADAEAMRDSVRQWLFASSILPATLPAATAVTSPIASPWTANCLRLSLGGSVPDAYFWPGSKPRLIVVHQGHDASLNNLGLGDVIREFARLGYPVLGCLMPGSGSSASHNLGTTPMRSFVDSVIGGLNHAFAGGCLDAVMVGLSGGGWTTVLAAAIDPRISRSYQVAGSLPLYMDSTSNRDWEQRLDLRGCPATYLDLYALGGWHGSQTQVLLVNDPVFPLAKFQRAADYRQLLEATAANLGGEFLVEWFDESVHQISRQVRWKLVEWITGQPVPLPLIRDSHDAGVVFAPGLLPTPNGWTPWAVPGYVNPGRFGASEHTHAATTAADYIEWPLDITGTVDFWATWSNHSNRATNAPYRIYDDGVQVGSEIRVNQELACADLLDAGVWWAYLGRRTIAGQCSARLCCDANEFVIADAVRAMRV